MTTHEFKLQGLYFDQVRSKTKTYELRVNDEKRRLVAVNDLIHLVNISEPDETITVRVLERQTFSTFDAAVKAVDYRLLMPEQPSEASTISAYKQIDNGRYETDAKRYGVVLFRLEVVGWCQSDLTHHCEY